MPKKKIFLLSKKYFNYFQNKNIEALKKIFALNISLKDWDNKKKGRKEVIKFNIEIFKKFKRIKVNVKERFYVKNFKIICFKLLIRKRSFEAFFKLYKNQKSN